ncbi:hypothetical protein C8T65DRAFT_106493 [Cerioporus squamosus]|nr:hypothetical protein C8T65DRAFT_106493 [Cerioporus squamosus]
MSGFPGTILTTHTHTAPGQLTTLHAPRQHRERPKPFEARHRALGLLSVPPPADRGASPARSLVHAQGRVRLEQYLRRQSDVPPTMMRGSGLTSKRPTSISALGLCSCRCVVNVRPRQTQPLGSPGSSGASATGSAVRTTSHHAADNTAYASRLRSASRACQTDYRPTYIPQTAHHTTERGLDSRRRTSLRRCGQGPRSA